jgi:hypothetical protein
VCVCVCFAQSGLGLRLFWGKFFEFVLNNEADLV